MSVIQFPKGVFTKDGADILGNLIKYFEKMEEEKRITEQERRDIVGALYSMKRVIELNAAGQLKRWFQAKARGWYRELDDFTCVLPEDEK